MVKAYNSPIITQDEYDEYFVNKAQDVSKFDHFEIKTHAVEYNILTALKSLAFKQMIELNKWQSQ